MKPLNKIRLSAGCFLFLLQWSTLPLGYGMGTRVGNGDDGNDLEGAVLITRGPIFESRKKAVELLRRLHVEGIPGLGHLIPETERSTLYLAKQDAPELVYARTMAEPDAPTRFFPAATKLDADQLLALQIHEALHRALPASIREDEAAVTKLTLAISTPDATHDQVYATAENTIPARDRRHRNQIDEIDTFRSHAESVSDEPLAPPDSFAALPSLVSYEFRTYQKNSDLSSRSTVQSMHVLQSFLYPFGTRLNSFGIGIEAALVQQPLGTIMGPLGLSARMRLWSGRGFDVGTYASYSMNMLSAAELKQSPFGRDVGTIGLSLKKGLDVFYVENFLGYSFGGSAQQTIGNVLYHYQYGGVVNASIHLGATAGIFKVGGFVAIDLADNYHQDDGGPFSNDTGRYRIISAGPEITARFKTWSLAGYGRVLVNAPEDIDFDSLGNLMGIGSGQSLVGIKASIYF